MEKRERLHLYREMVRIRYFEEKVRELAMANRLPGFFHLYVGEEAVAVAFAEASPKARPETVFDDVYTDLQVR